MRHQLAHHPVGPDIFWKRQPGEVRGGRGSSGPAFLCQGQHRHGRRLSGSQYLAGWVIARLEGIEAARGAMHYVAPVGEKDEYIERMLRNITPYLSEQI